MNHVESVVPAQAGTQWRATSSETTRGSRLRGNDEMKLLRSI